MNKEFIRISDGVDGLMIINKRFNTTKIVVNFYLPLNKDTSYKYSLLSGILSSCSEQYADYIKLNKTLCDMYGSGLNSDISVKENYLNISFSGTCINNEYTFNKENLVNRLAEIMVSVLFFPKTKNGAFYEEDVNREKRKLIEHIRSEFSEKRLYARKRLIEEMFSCDPFGTYVPGTENEVNSVTCSELYSVWKELLSSSYVRINIVSNREHNEVFDVFKREFGNIDRNNIVNFIPRNIPLKSEKLKRKTEFQNVSQGKLAMGFTTDRFGEFYDIAPYIIMCDLFGGGPYSRLFTVVREKLSLCYYCTASFFNHKGFILVDSGVEKENFEKTEKAILEQLEIIKHGKFEDYELESSKKSIIDRLSSVCDSQTRTELWYSGRFFNNGIFSYNDLIEQIKNVTREDVIKAAFGVKYNTVFSLIPSEDKE